MKITKQKKTQKISSAQKEKELRITQLVFDFQDGKDTAGELLVYYDNLFNAYKSLLKDGNYRINSRSVTEFVKLFIGDKNARREVKKHSINKSFHDMVGHIRFCMQDLDEKDIEHELKLIFLNLAKNWKKMDGIVFTGYINGYFHYSVKDWVKRHMTVSYKGRDREDMDALTNIVVDQDPADLTMSDDIDEDWIAGYSCKWPFTELTKEEREDVVDLMFNKLSRSQFAYKKCYDSLADVSSRKKYLKDKIRLICKEGRK